MQKKKTKMKKQQRKCFIRTIVQRDQFCLKKQTLFCKNDLGNSGTHDFIGFSILRYVWVFCVGFATVSVNFLYFLQKYRCVPKIGFSPDIFLTFSFMFFRSIVVHLKLGSRLTFLFAFLLTSLWAFLSAFVLTF